MNCHVSDFALELVMLRAHSFVSVCIHLFVSLQIRVVKVCNFHIHGPHDLKHLIIMILALAFEVCVCVWFL